MFCSQLQQHSECVLTLITTILLQYQADETKHHYITSSLKLKQLKLSCREFLRCMSLYSFKMSLKLMLDRYISEPK